MKSPLNIVYVIGSDLSDEENKNNNRLIKEFNINPINVENMLDVFSLLGDLTFNVDFVFIEAEKFNETKNHSNTFSLIQTMETLIKCREYQKNSNLTSINKGIKVVITVNNQTNPALIKEFVHIPGLILGLRFGGTVTYDMMSNNIRNLINGDYSTPKLILQLLHSNKKKKRKNNQIYLTPRQTQIYNIVSNQGCSNKVIARMLGISESTVKLHLGTVFKKLGVQTRTQLAAFAKDE